MSCDSTYTAWTGLTLGCTGDHLRGNAFRGEVHQARYAGITWTWYGDEADPTPALPARATQHSEETK